MNYVNAIEQPRKRTAKNSRKNTYIIYEVKYGTLTMIGKSLQYNDELAIAWALRELKKNRDHYKQGDRCELWMMGKQYGEYRIQGFRRGA